MDFLLVATTVFESHVLTYHKTERLSLTQLFNEPGIDRIYPSHGLHQIFLPELDLHRSSRLQNASPGRKVW